MNGVPVTIMRDGNKERVYLSTRRSGEVGEKIRKLKRQYKKLEIKMSTMLKKSFLVMTTAERIAEKASEEKLEDLSAKQDEYTEKARELADEALDVATEIVKCCLRENHKADTEAIMDCMTDRQIRACITALETGEEPADFFPSSGTQPSASGTGQQEDTTSKSSSPTATPKKTSKAGE